MAKNRGYTLSEKNYAEVARLVRDARRTPVQYTRYQRKSVPFQPGAGSKVYLCVAGTRLKYGTVEHEDDQSYREPAVLGVLIGSTADDDLPCSKNQELYDLQKVINSLGIINNDNIIDKDSLESLANDPQITDITNGQGLTMLRVRGCPGYVGTGDIVVGNDTEAWWGSGEQIRQATLWTDWTDGTDKVRARLEVNAAARENHVVDQTVLIYDTIAIATPHDEAICMSEDDVVNVSFAQQVFLQDDTAYEDFYWHQDDTYGWIPVFHLVNPPLQQSITHVNSETEIPAYGCVVITSPGADTTGVTTVKRPFAYGAQYSHIFNGPNAIDPGESGWAQTGDSRLIALYDPADGTPAVGEMWGPYASTYKLKKNAGGFVVRGVIDSTNYLVLVDRDPMLSGIGKTDAAIAKGASGTVSVYSGTLGSETDTTYNVTAYNRFADVAISKWVRWAWNSGSQGYDLVSAEC